MKFPQMGRPVLNHYYWTPNDWKIAFAALFISQFLCVAGDRNPIWTRLTKRGNLSKWSCSGENAKVWLHLRDKYDKGLECQPVSFLPFLLLSERQISVSYFRLVSSHSSPVYPNLLTSSPENKLLVEFSGPKCKNPEKVPSVGQGDSDVHPMLWQQRQATQEDATTTGIICLEKGEEHFPEKKRSVLDR